MCPAPRAPSREDFIEKRLAIIESNILSLSALVDDLTKERTMLRKELTVTRVLTEGEYADAQS
jgi:hypothetical protein